MTVTDADEDEVEYEPMREARPNRGRRLGIVLLSLALAVLLVVGGTAVWAERQINPAAAGAEVSVVIPPGSTVATIARILQHEGVIKSATVFRYYARFKSIGALQAGSYTLRKHQDFDAVVKLLRSGPKLVFDRLTIPEGLTLEETAARVGQLPGRSADKFLQLATTGAVRSKYEPVGSNNLEGLVFPETYQFEPKDDEAAILRRLIAGFERTATELGLDEAPAKVGLSPLEVVIVASMIEREAKVPEDRGMIARVIYNRLKSGTPLGIDATLRYGIHRPKEPLRASDLANDMPYNTRLRKGLPPTPIASPGRASLEAALNPTPGLWMFYVLADASGKHAFLNTAAEFERAVAECKRKSIGC